LDSANSPLFWAHFPWIHPWAIYYGLFRITRAISDRKTVVFFANEGDHQYSYGRVSLAGFTWRENRAYCASRLPKRSEKRLQSRAISNLFFIFPDIVVCTYNWTLPRRFPVILNSKNHFPGICPSVICDQMFWITPVILNLFFRFPREFNIARGPLRYVRCSGETKRSSK